ncbi:CotH kinase family protein [Lysinibacillus sphaericus]|uniref:Inner spore coat protein H n=1 Tax=Lysinibacillus sphaericus OT4b.31 TaxID=1285586 RepID=R7ZAA9_LYSSH|nr:CotH kinase family protein [Lysinibacillus sphaericus]EON71048.1 inner spore coat protein H [Lysinibacillus sphaericus OT4b.31]
MIKNRVVYSCMAILLALFIVMLAILPNIGIKTKSNEFSYETLVFNKNKVTTVDIEIAEEDWEDMLENAEEEEFKQANITVNGKRVENVAIRTKGNISLSSVVNSDSDRYSLKIDFDYYDHTKSLFGLKKMNLNNNYSDSTLMREYISYELMEKMGLPTPAHSYMYITVNGEERGLYLGVEAVDETFLANNYGSNSGFLFKPDGVGSDLQYISDNISDYKGINLKTNEGNSDKSKLVEMLDAINNDGDIEKYIDVDEMLRYFAVNTAIVNLDSYQGRLKHNYYLYEDKGVFSIIPWDYNMSFGGLGGDIKTAGGANILNKSIDNDETFEMESMDSADSIVNKDTIQQKQQFPANDTPPLINDQDGWNIGQDNLNQDDGTPQDGSQQNGGLPQGTMNMDMLMDMSSNLMSDSAINFSIKDPVFGVTLEERPLLNVLLSNDEYRKVYENYLEELAKKYLTEEYFQNITNGLSAMLTTYVEADPTKFSTTAQFLEGVQGENSLPEFAKQRSASILKQLSGELVIEANPGNDMQGGEPFPEDFAFKFDSQLPEDFDPSQMPQGPPQMNVEGNQDGDIHKQGQVGGKIGPNKGNEQVVQPSGIDKNTTITSGVLCIVLLLALTFVFRFNRRGI